QRRNTGIAVVGASPHAFGKAQERPDEALRRLIEREALQAGLVLEAALDEHLDERDAEFRLALRLFLDFGGGPRHQRHVIKSDGPLASMEAPEKRAFPEEIVGTEDIYKSLN